MNFDCPALVYISDSSPLFPTEYKSALLALYYADIISVDALISGEDALSKSLANEILEKI